MEKPTRNAEGYYDPTAYEAIKNYRKDAEKMKAKEIWEIKMNNGKFQDFLVLAVNGTVATGLNILELYGSNLIEITCGGIKYVDARKLQYAYDDMASQFIRVLKDEEFDAVMADVTMKLGIDVLKTVPDIKTIAEPKVEVVKESKIPSSRETELNVELKLELTKAQTERDIYKNLYEQLSGKLFAEVL